VAGSSAYAKGVSLRIIEPRPDLVRERLAEGEQLRVALLGRAVPVVRTPDGLRAVNKGKPCNSAQCEKYLTGDHWRAAARPATCPTCTVPRSCAASWRALVHRQYMSLQLDPTRR